MSTVSQILLDIHGISMRPGGKGDCPFCHNKYFSLKSDDSLGKCFYPACGRFLTLGRENGQYQYSFARVLEALYHDCHQDLLALPSTQQNALTYVRDERGIHPQVIQDAMLGAVPSSYDVMPRCQPVLDEAQKAVDALRQNKRGRPTKELVQAEERLEKLKDAVQKLVDCLAHRAGWLAFFYCDAVHRCVALRLRQPYTKHFVSFKPAIAGVFGRELFTPFANPAHHYLNDFLLVVEGEFNALQLQSLMVRLEEATGETQGYLNACAVGSVTTADVGTLARVAPHPVIVYDNDATEVGFELVKRVQKVMPVEACTTPLSWGTKSDLDSYLCEFHQDHVVAWEAVKALIADRQPYGRIYSGTGEEFFDYPITGGKKVFTPRLLGEADWATGELQPHTPAVFTTVQLPVEYGPEAPCPAFDQYLASTFDPDVALLIEEILGWCLVPDRRFEQAIMLTGEGANGKSVFLDLVSYLLGEENVSNVALQDLEENRFRAAELYAKLANVFADLDARGLQTSSMFKTLTTGDPITAERKHAQPFRFRSYAKLLFSANKIPPSRDRTHAFYRRWTLIPFTRTFDGKDGNPIPDKGLRDKLKQERAGIFNRALVGLKRLALNQAFTEPKSVLEAKQAYIRSNDNVRVFVEECVIPEADNPIVKKEFYQVYENWCDKYGARAISQKALKEALMQVIPKLDEWRESAHDPWSWLGMRWSPDADDYMPPSMKAT